MWFFCNSFFGVNDTIIKHEPRLEYDIISEIDFLNNSESSPYIKVFIEDSIDVQEKHYNITAYNIKVENKGKKHISYHDYDEGFFGLKVNHGVLLDVPFLLSATNENIQKNFHTDPKSKGNSRIEIPKLSIDIGDNYIIKIVLLHNADSIPEFYREGKIVGQKEIYINKIQKPSVTFWSRTFEGVWWAQIVRLVSYSIIGFALFFAVISLIEKIQDANRKKKREKAIKQREEEISKLNLMLSIKEEYINYIRNNGRYYYINDIDDYIGPDSIIMTLYKIYTMDDEAKITDRFQKMSDLIKYGRNNHSEEDYYRVKNKYEEYKYFINKGYLILNNRDMSITFNNEAKESIIKLFDFLDNIKPRFDTEYKRSKTIDEILDTIHDPSMAG